MAFRSKKHIKAETMSSHGDGMLNRSLPNLDQRFGAGTGRRQLGDSFQYHEHAQRFSDQMPEKKKRSWKKIFKRTFLILVIAALISGGWIGWKAVSNSAKIFGWKNLFGLFENTKLKGEDSGRVTILMAGDSADRTDNGGGGDLTDSIMLVSLDTKGNTATLLSVPRDLYVAIPGHGYGKINEVYEDGKTDNFNETGYATGGMGFLEKVISQNFGMTINYYALVNYSALVNAVNAVGGVMVNIQSNDPRGLYDPSVTSPTDHTPLVHLSNGVHTLNGAQALNLARARGDSYGAYGYGLSDFVRTQNQRQIIIALKDKITSSSTLSNPIKIGELFDSFGSNVKTDLTLADARRMYTLSKKIPTSAITSAAFNDGKDVNLLTNYRTKYGQSALIPAAGLDDYSQIQTFIQKLFGTTSTTSTSTTTTQ